MEQQQISVTSASLATGLSAITALRSLDVVQNLGLIERPPCADDRRVTLARLTRTGRELPTVSLLFAPGDRSSVDRVRALGEAERSFLVSFDPEEDAGPGACKPAERWLEVLANGLTFDLQGLAPGAPQPLPPSRHCYGLSPDFNGGALEAISLRPGPHIAASGPMLPVVRGLARLAAVLADLPGVRAVGWHAARTLSAPDHFRGSVLRWLEGGAFPGLGLTALAPTLEGGLQSEGLALFTGQELRVAPELARDQAAGARLALRLLHHLVEHGQVDAPAGLPGPSGEPLVLEPSDNKRFVEVSGG